jgi:hypothetical protein
MKQVEEWHETGAWGEERSALLDILMTNEIIILNRQFGGATESRWKFKL